MEQTKSLNALEPFLALTKSASSPRAAADLIARATTAPNTFIFAELLTAPQIQSLTTSPDYSSSLTLLKIFSYGTYATYTSTPDLPVLNEAQTLKLRQLSFLTLAKNPADLNYANLLSALGLQTERELEDLVISAIYAGLVQGMLDPHNKTVLISSVSPLRDLPPNSIPSMLSTLSAWSSRCTSTLSNLERQIASIKAEATKRHREEAEWNAHVEKLMEGKGEKPPGDGEGRWGLGKRGGKKANGGGVTIGGDGWEDDDMDVDDDDVEDEKRGKKRGFGALSFGK
ncbi:COP9 signalosome complex subunit 7a [Hyphodiscus hymeniophilus]|uniref:COP9 signalosome complex subunit 7a n=1 Tax=Hyphodiscus hymeniophilus TaxID=353542 RepID=A0A9P7B091_9HELO|nr:COP9 signalosome complex subunit 7a [Hyphodiscus hymeniophilus]